MLQKPDPGISATPHENNLRYFNVVIAGPQDSAYDGADFSLFELCLILCSHSPPLGVF
jgi:ubiquitin-conjugating enzyme E2 N